MEMLCCMPDPNKCAVGPPDSLKARTYAKIDIDYEALPPAREQLSEGSVIAYKMLELDASMCPVVLPLLLSP